jgi:hypothetical protein
VLRTLPPSVSRLSKQCGILNISQPYRPPQPVTGIALLYYLSHGNSLLHRFLKQHYSSQKLPWHQQSNKNEMSPVSSVFLCQHSVLFYDLKSWTNKTFVITDVIDRLPGLVIRVPGYTTEMYCVSCEVRIQFFLCNVEGSRPPTNYKNYKNLYLPPALWEATHSPPAPGNSDDKWLHLIFVIGSLVTQLTRTHFNVCIRIYHTVRDLGM